MQYNQIEKMKGKKLHKIITSIDVSEKRQLLHICSKSDDKRHFYLEKLLRYEYNSVENFQNALHSLAIEYFPLKNSIENDKFLRRFISFAANEIENLKIKNFLAQNQNFKNHILKEIYVSMEQFDLSSIYHKKNEGIHKQQ